VGDIDLTFGCPMKRLLFFLTAMIFASSSFLIAHEEEMQIESEELMILANKNDSSILDYSDGIFYLNPKNLLFSMEGIFLKTDSGYRVPLKSISFDSVVGYYKLVKTLTRICSNPDCEKRISKYAFVCPWCKEKQPPR
jgi:hypothetical protein